MGYYDWYGKAENNTFTFSFFFHLLSRGFIEVLSIGNAYDNAGCSNELRDQRGFQSIIQSIKRSI